jgi:DNA-directed RNA polymerase subunit N (RpoN/RPB10)
MIIPMRCFGCGKLIADKWNTYKKRVYELKINKEEQVQFIEGNKKVITPEGIVLTELGIERWCCRKHFLTHKDLMDKI